MTLFISRYKGKTTFRVSNRQYFPVSHQNFFELAVHNSVRYHSAQIEENSVVISRIGFSMLCSMKKDESNELNFNSFSFCVFSFISPTMNNKSNEIINYSQIGRSVLVMRNLYWNYKFFSLDLVKVWHLFYDILPFFLSRSVLKMSCFLF